MTPSQFRPGLLLCIALAHASIGCKKSSPVASTPEPPSAQRPATLAAPWFTDITTATHLDFQHVTGTNWFMADQVGAGIVLQDLDGDGLTDVYCLQNGGRDHPAPNQLWKQLPGLLFTNVASGSGTDIAGRGMGAIAGDVNNDGLPDLVVTEYGGVRLLWNRGAMRFQEIAHAAGIDNPRWAVPASFIDFDRDGRLDVVIGNYLDYDPTQVCHDVQGRRDFCSPEAFPATVSRLFRNTTSRPGEMPRFEDVTERSGLTRAPGVALGIVCADFTGDGWPDIFMADDGRPNRLFVNKGNGTFTEEAAMRGLGFNAMGRTAANMGTAFGDFDADGRFDVFVTHLTEEFHSLYLQDQPGLFRDAIGSSGLQVQSWRGTGFGAVAADFDNNGTVDIAIANGLVSQSTPPQSPPHTRLSPWWRTYAQRAQLFSNQGLAGFKDLSEANPALCGSALVGRSLAVADWDQDGGMDLLLGSIAGPLLVLKNSAPDRGHWVQFRLIEPALGGRDALGAEVLLATSSRTNRAVLQPATSYLANHEPLLHFGLGRDTTIDRVEVLWGDGSRERFPGLQTGKRHVLKHGEGQR